MIKLDLTISLGTIIQTVIFVAGFLWAGTRLYGEFREMRFKINTLWVMIVGDPESATLEGRGLEGRVYHAVRNAINQPRAAGRD